MKIRMKVTVFWTALLIAAAVGVVVVSRNRQHLALPLEVPAVAPVAEVRVKAVERKSEQVERGELAAASDAVSIGRSMGSDPMLRAGPLGGTGTPWQRVDLMPEVFPIGKLSSGTKVDYGGETWSLGSIGVGAGPISGTYERTSSLF